MSTHDVIWNPWHGCHKISEGCLHCYMFRHDERYGHNPNDVHQTSDFYLPRKLDRHHHPKIPSNSTIYTCFTSDFFIEEADEWRKEAYQMMKERSDCQFFLTTKRIDRFWVNLPDDWNQGYTNVTIAVTIESQNQAQRRLPLYLNLPIAHKVILCEPLLDSIDLTPYLSKSIERVSVGGESGPQARACNYDWVLDIRKQCIEASVAFNFRQTGARLIKDGKEFRIPRPQQLKQASKAKIDT